MKWKTQSGTTAMWKKNNFFCANRYLKIAYYSYRSFVFAVFLFKKHATSERKSTCCKRYGADSDLVTMYLKVSYLFYLPLLEKGREGKKVVGSLVEQI